jgi:group I intron endonuclease
MPDLNCGVYAIVNKENQKSYVGSSKDLAKRRHDHFKDLQAGAHNNRYLQRAFEKYGMAVFSFRVLLFCEEDERIRYERELIIRSKPEYNMVISDESGLRQYTPEVRARMSKSHTGVKLGPHSEEHKRKISLSHTGKKQGPPSEETKLKLSISHLGKKHGPMSEEQKQQLREANLGKKNGPCSEETKNKISQALTGRFFSDEWRERISAGQLGKKRSPRSEEHKQAIRQSLMGHPVSDETKEKIRVAHMGTTHEGNKNFRQTEETRRKISESMKRYKASLRSSNGS